MRLQRSSSRVRFTLCINIDNNTIVIERVANRPEECMENVAVEAVVGKNWARIRVVKTRTGEVLFEAKTRADFGTKTGAEVLDIIEPYLPVTMVFRNSDAYNRIFQVWSRGARGKALVRNIVSAISNLPRIVKGYKPCVMRLDWGVRLQYDYEKNIALLTAKLGFKDKKLLINTATRIAHILEQVFGCKDIDMEELMNSISSCIASGSLPMFTCGGREYVLEPQPLPSLPVAVVPVDSSMQSSSAYGLVISSLLTNNYVYTASMFLCGKGDADV